MSCRSYNSKCCTPCYKPCCTRVEICTRPCRDPCDENCHVDSFCQKDCCRKYCSDRCDCHKCQRKHKKKKCKDSSSSSDSSDSEGVCRKKYDNSNPCKKKKKKKNCDKCYRRDCDCTEYYTCIRTKCGLVKICLSVATEPPSFMNAGEIINYVYTITNTGNAAICGTLRICDSRLGSQIIPEAYIAPNGRYIAKRSYTITAADVDKECVKSIVTAFAQVKCRKWVCSEPVCFDIKYGSADLTGSITQTTNEEQPGVIIVTVTITNNGPSTAEDIKLCMPLPAHVTNIVDTSEGVVVNATKVCINWDSLANGSSQVFTFDYIPNVTTPGTTYTWTGDIKSCTYDPDPDNNHVTNTYTIPPV